MDPKWRIPTYLLVAYVHGFARGVYHHGQRPEPKPPMKDFVAFSTAVNIVLFPWTAADDAARLLRCATRHTKGVPFPLQGRWSLKDRP